MSLRNSLVFVVAKLGSCVVKLPNTFGDHMVLPAVPDNSYIHGLAEPGEEVTVALTGAVVHTYQTIGQADGTFRVRMRHVGTTTATNITVSGSQSDTSVVAADVRWGDVVVCAGQSNMEFSIKVAARHEEIVGEVDRYSDIIRLFKTPRFKGHRSLFEVDCDPDFDPKSCQAPIGWTVPSEESVTTFSAVCYLYATALINQTGKATAIGLIESAVGNTDIVSWSPASSIYALDKTDTSLECHEPTDVDDVQVAGYGNLFYGMISPHRFNPVTAWVWYQGEHNAHRDVNTPAANYECWFRSMVWTWRHYFVESAEKPFLYVQLSDASTYKALGAIRDAQQRINFDMEGGVPGVGMAVAMDIGTAGTVHPKNKTEVGRRLALTARSLVYNETGVSFRGPQVASFTQSGQELRVTMDHASCLKWDATHDCSTCCDRAGMSFQVTTGLFGDSVNVTMDVASHGTLTGSLPVGFKASHIRYGFDLFPQCVLRNCDLLPAGAFMYPPYRYPRPMPVAGQGAPQPVHVQIGGNPTRMSMNFANASGSLRWSDACESKSFVVTNGLFGVSAMLAVDVDSKKKTTMVGNADEVPFLIYSLRYRSTKLCYLIDDAGVHIADFDVFVPDFRINKPSEAVTSLLV